MGYFRKNKYMTGMKKSSSVKSLSIAVLAGCASFGMGSQVQAADTPITPTLGDNSSYTLTEVATPTDNSITLYKYDNTGITEAINYEVNLKQTTYGEGDNVRHYKWEVDSNGDKLFVQSIQSDADIIVRYGVDNSTKRVIVDNAALRGPIQGYGNTDLGTIDGVFINNSAGDDGAAIYVLDNVKINNISGDFIGNYTYDGSSYNSKSGGAMYLAGSGIIVNSITGNFIGNSSFSDGGAAQIDLGTNGYLATLESNFIGNKAGTYGGALTFWSSDIGTIKSNFISNVSKNDGGAILFYSSSGISYKVNDISSDFVNNKALGNGGAISLWGQGAIELESVTSNFLGNRAYDGGAIENYETINYMNSNFISNRSERNGGAILNGKSIIDLNGQFFDNSANKVGGAIYNKKQIENISGAFIGNSVNVQTSSSSEDGLGGAIYNDGTIGDVMGLFVGNYVQASSTSSSSDAVIDAYGGAIYNASSSIESLNGDFVNNYAKSSILGTTYAYASSYGGAISNDKSAEIGDISGNFVGNYVSSNSVQTNNYRGQAHANSYGGAIYNNEKSKIGNITGDFVGNYAYAKAIHYGGAYGGTIYNSNQSTIEDILGDFIGNYVLSEARAAFGGSIYNNNSSIGSITGDFIGNKVYANDGSSAGGAIYSDSSISNINGNFIENSVTTASGWAQGGALFYSFHTLGSITGDFIRNNVNGTHGGDGGAIYFSIASETSSLGDINSNFIENYAIATEGDTRGGAIYNGNGIGNIGRITGNFVNNYIQSYSDPNGDPDLYHLQSNAKGGAIYNTGGIENIIGGFEGNNAKAESRVFGGAIYNSGTLGDITGDFVENYAHSENLEAYGGAIYNAAKMSSIDGDFINNKVVASTISQGGAIWTVGGSSDFEVPEGTLMYGDYQIVNEDGSIYKSLYIVTDGNSSFTEEQIKELVADGTVTNMEFIRTLEKISKSEFDATLIENNMSEEDFYLLVAQQGMITTDPNTFLATGDVVPTITQLSVDDVRANEAAITLKNSNLIGNHADSVNGEAKGGAIYGENATIKFNADNGETTLISGNYTKNGDVIDDNAIYMSGGKLIFDVTNGSTIQLDDNINGENDYETYIIGDNASKFVLNNKIKNSTTHLVDTNLYLLNESNLDGNNLKLHSGMLSMINNQAGVSALDRLVVTGDTNVLVDVDLANQTMDRFTATEYGVHGGNLNVTGMNLLSDAVNDKTEILFAEQGLKDNVVNKVQSVVDSANQTTLFTPIYKYNVSYDNRDDAGYFVFARQSSSSGNQSEVFNPAVLGSSSTATVGALGTINQTFNYAFNNSDTFMNIPYLERISMRDRNKYALSITGDATDMGRFSPLYQPSDEEASVWVKPYATFENVPLKNGPKVSNITYGTLVGFDTEMQSLRNGWDRVWTGYIGYNGASQRYSGIDSTQNGGLIGGTMTLYKGNFFNATTVSVGANVAQNQTMYGSEDFAMLLSGIGNKTGYNFEFKEGKLILQPSMLMSYTFVNTFDYTNAAGVRIDNKPLHALQLAPGVKVIGNLKGGWQPYASVQMVWNLMGESDARANGVKLPEMSIKPYVQYGVGVQKRIKDHFTAYGQAMVQNGGRNGVSLTAGFRWALGHDNCKYKVEDKQLRGKAAKSKRHCEEQSDVAIQSNGEILNQVQDDRGKYIDNKTSSLDVGGVMPRAAEHKKILKQMTPQQRVAYGGKYMNTSRTAKTGSLRQY